MNIPTSLPESTAPKRTRQIAKIGLSIYALYGILIILILPLILISDATITNKLIFLTMGIVLLYLILYRNTKQTLELYETGILSTNPFRKIAFAIITGFIAPPLILIAIYNIVLGIHFYRKLG